MVIVGRANVGKSSLFNRILKRRAAVVSDREGVTRDLHYQMVEWNNKYFELVDTGGFIPDVQDILNGLVKDRIQAALDEASLVLFVVDGKSGAVEEDLRFAKMVQKYDKPTVLCVNKSESTSVQQDVHEFWRLGLGEPRSISAKNGMGVAEILDEIAESLPRVRYDEDDYNTIKIAILGRPNSGKSTLLNQLVGEYKAIVTDIAGTTRDSIDANLEYQGQKFLITDTAGFRKKRSVKDEVEIFSNMRATESIRRSDVCVLMVDAERGLEIQDLKIMEMAQEQGKGLVLVLNKWDLIEVDSKTYDNLVKELYNRVPELKWVPILSISAKSGKRVQRVLDEVVKVKLNLSRVLGRDNVVEYFQECISKNPHPHSYKGPVRLDKCCQVMINPPALAIQCGRPDLLLDSYIRYLKNSAYERFELAGTPLKIYFRRNLKLRTDEDLRAFSEGVFEYLGQREIEEVEED